MYGLNCSCIILAKIKIHCYGQTQAIKQRSVHPCWEKWDMTTNQDIKLKEPNKIITSKSRLKIMKI